MTTIIKILLAVAVLNAAVRVGLAAANYYELKDATQELMTFGAQAPADDLQNQILRKAADLHLPVAADQAEVTRDGSRTSATVSYTEPVEVFPNYTYPITFHFSVDGVSMGGLGANQGQPVRR